jgi:hypothetical protein
MLEWEIMTVITAGKELSALIDHSCRGGDRGLYDWERMIAISCVLLAITNGADTGRTACWPAE